MGANIKRAFLWSKHWWWGEAQAAKRWSELKLLGKALLGIVDWLWRHLFAAKVVRQIEPGRFEEVERPESRPSVF